MSLLVLSAADVDKIIKFLPPSDIQVLMAKVFFIRSKQPQDNADVARWSEPTRSSISTPSYTTLFMPARLSDGALKSTAIKVVSVPRSSGDMRGLPGSTLLLDEETGVARAIINARSLTALRNAAGSLLSTNLVGPRYPTSIVAFGAGKQVEAHLSYHLQYFPSITKCTIVNRSSNARATAVVKFLQTSHPSVSIGLLAFSATSESKSTQSEENVRSALRSADIIVCATSSTVPLFPTHWVRDGAHVILIGSYTPSMREVEKTLVLRAVAGDGRPSLLVDSREACSLEAGELIDADLNSSQLVEIGELVDFDHQGVLQPPPLKFDSSRSSNDTYNGPITMFKSVGVGVQDVAIAWAIYQKAVELGDEIGTRIVDYDL